MRSPQVQRIPIVFDAWYAVLSSIVGLLPSHSYLLVSHDVMRVRMGWAFRATFPRRAILSVRMDDRRPLSRGVHGFAGRWLVNGSGRGIVVIDLDPIQRCHLLGLPLPLRQLLISVANPGALVALLGDHDGMTKNEQSIPAG